MTSSPSTARRTATRSARAALHANAAADAEPLHVFAQRELVIRERHAHDRTTGAERFRRASRPAVNDDRGRPPEYALVRRRAHRERVRRKRHAGRMPDDEAPAAEICAGARDVSQQITRDTRERRAEADDGGRRAED
jgi:hypothetical protein